MDTPSSTIKIHKCTDFGVVIFFNYLEQLFVETSCTSIINALGEGTRWELGFGIGVLSQHSNQRLVVIRDQPSVKHRYLTSLAFVVGCWAVGSRLRKLRRSLRLGCLEKRKARSKRE